MSKRLQQWLLPAVAAGLISFGFWLDWRNEPRFQGKSVRHWFWQYYIHNARAYDWGMEGRTEAVQALRAIGTNAVPYLLREAFSQRQDTILTCASYEIRRHRQRKPAPFVSADDVRLEALNALRALKPPARVVLPLLTNALQDAGVFRRRTALMILGDVGDGAEEGVPYLVLALKDRDPLERVLAAQSLKWLGSPARSALPAMIEALRKPRLPIALVQTIGSFGSEAAAAVPALETSLSSASQNERWAAAVALHLIVPSHVQARTMLAGALTSTNDPMARESALGALQRITTGATNLVPEVREAARNPDGTLNIGAIEVLRRMSTDAAIDFLLERLSDDQPEVQLQSAGWLLRIEPRNWQARTFLMEFLKSPLLSSNRYVRWREFAIQQLAEASPDAADAIALLKKIAGNRNDAASRAAEAALKRIQKPQDF